jgi:hypothetical protein
VLTSAPGLLRDGKSDREKSVQRPSHVQTAFGRDTVHQKHSKGDSFHNATGGVILKNFKVLINPKMLENVQKAHKTKKI